MQSHLPYTPVNSMMMNTPQNNTGQLGAPPQPVPFQGFASAHPSQQHTMNKHPRSFLFNQAVPEPAAKKTKPASTASRAEKIAELKAAGFSITEILEAMESI